MSHSGHSTRAIIQVQKGAPAKLLVGTDLLPKLGYYFVQASGESSNCNVLDNALDASVHKSDDRERKDEVTQGNVDNCDIPSIGVHKSDNGDRVFVYMLAAKATKAYKFARPFHGPYRIIEQSDTGVVVRQIDKPQAEPIRVAYNRIRHYCDSLPNKFWPTRARSNKRLSARLSSADEGATKQQVTTQDIKNPWKHRLRPRRTGGDT